MEKGKKSTKKLECDFCKARTDGKLILKDMILKKKDDSDIVVCSTCLELYVHENFEELTKRVKK
jgi:transcription elongation factor Elf1